MNTEEKYICVSRPRRFRKSMAVKMLTAYYNKSADTAIRQIKDKQYTQIPEGYSGEILLVGINYDKDSENKQHSCVIEKMMYGMEQK